KPSSPSNRTPPSHSTRWGSRGWTSKPRPTRGPSLIGSADPRLRLREIEEGGDLEVLRIARDREDRAARELEQGGIVGDAESRGFCVLVRLAQQIHAER